MKSLYNTILESDKIDGHIHLFDHAGIINQSLIDTSKRCVCFADISFKYIDKYKGEKMINLYDDFINEYYDNSKHILLATGENSDDIISIYEKYPDIISGFGELKCYSEYIHGKLPYGNLNWIKPVLDYNINIGLPVYIHYNLETNKQIIEFSELLKKYKFPIILCHCGMYDNCKYENIHNILLELTKTFNNLYIDISYSATDYYLSNLNKLLEFDNKKIIIGTDINGVIYRKLNNPEKVISNLYDNFYKLHRLGNFNIAIQNIFLNK